MITIFHGDDISSSRKQFLGEKQRAADSYFFDGKKIELTDLVQVLEGGSLFQTEKNIFIEEFISGRKDSKEKDELIQFLSKRSDQIRLFLWENKDISKLKNSLVKKAILQSFNFPKTLFSFLDSIKPRSKQNIPLFHQALETSDEQIIFSMLIRQFRFLLAIHSSSSTPIDEMKRLAPWQETKLVRQSRLFSQQELKTAYEKLFQIDLAIKTGSTSRNLSQNIDIFLLSL